MKRSVICLSLTAALLAGAISAYADPWRTTISVDFGTAKSIFGLSNPPFFNLPVQNNSSTDGVLSGTLEYLLVRRGPVELGLAAKGSFAFSGWNLGNPGVSDGFGNFFPDDNVHISSNWWALAGMGTLHIHMGRWVTLDGALGYGPYGYSYVAYWDDAGVVSGPIGQSSAFFPESAWAVDWSAGLSFRLYWSAALSLNVGMMGPDFVAGVGVTFPLGRSYRSYRSYQRSYDTVESGE